MRRKSVEAFIAAERGRRFRPGARDCGLLLADWSVYLTGRDPAADLRGRYRSMAEASELIRREGGFVAMLERRLAWPRLARAIDGAAACCVAPGQEMAFGALRLGDFWISRAPRGVVMMRDDQCRALRIWGASCLW